MAISSEQITKDIVDQLYWDQSVDASDIIVEVDEGAVRLSGTVPSESARRAAHNDAIMIPGVTSVENNIKVEPSDKTASESDEDLRDKVENVLNWNTDIDDTSVSVTARSGRVTLNGFVDGCWKKIRAEELVAGLAGVREIVNALTVVPTQSRSDKIIADDIMSALRRRTDVDINRIDVEVENGTVTISGTVDNPSTAFDIDYIVRRTGGVVDVVNRLQAQRENEPAYWKFS